MNRIDLFQRGGSALKALVVVPVAFLVAGIGWYAFASLRLQYWDGKVRELCAKEGGVKVLQHVALTPAEYASMPRTGGRVAGHAPLELSRPEVPTYAQYRQDVIREWNPQVWKMVGTVIRKSDSATVARWVHVNRLGGDPIAIDHPSSFSCPPAEQTSAELETIFVIKEIK